ncbi:MAG TPA: oxygenase MpaB family protein [Streptosporangiaceae bacterium]|jgi:uncharacterized protein (DUF2236 family)
MSDSYAADAAGLVQRSAAAFIAAVPEQPCDEGYFGPASVTWRVASDLSVPVAGLRALLIQALHPLAMAGVDQHSDWRRDPVGRLAATSAYLATVTFGDRAAADRVAARVRMVHEHVRGTVDGTAEGEPYSASDPGLLLWVHATFVDSGLAGCELFGTPADADAYVREMAISAALLGVPEEQIPADAASLSSFITSLVPRLALTPAAQDSAAYLLDPPGMEEEIAELWQEIRDAVLISLPSWALDLYGLTAPADANRDEIRGALGLLDAVFMGEPGMVEARQRITLRVRAA